MPRMSSNLETTKGFTTIESGWYNARVAECKPTIAKITKNPMLEISWQIVDHPKHNNRTIPFNSVMTGGKDKNGNQMSLNRLLDYIDALQVPYVDARGCGNEQQHVLKRREDYLCPGCEAPLAGIDYATEDFVGKIAKIYVDTEPQKRKNELTGELEDTGEQRNRVTQVKTL